MESILDMKTKDKLIELREFINNEFNWYIKHSPDYGVVPRILAKISELEAEIAKEKDEKKGNTNIDINLIGRLIKEAHDDYNNPVSSIDWVMAASSRIFSYINSLLSSSRHQENDRKDEPMIFEYRGYWSDDAQSFFEDNIITEQRDGCAVVGNFLKLSDGSVCLPSKGDKFIKDKEGNIFKH
jgi:hypothetical protein